MTKLDNLKIAICQMPVIAGRPDLNADYIIDEIDQAVKRKVDIIVFPEMCVGGYFVGDLYEDDFFVEDIQRFNEQIREATRSGITCIWGSLVTEIGRRGEDGRLRKFNAALVARNGDWAGRVIKTLQPNYRMFDDDRHLYSRRKCWAEKSESEQIKPLSIELGDKTIAIGVVLCEDMWHRDYPLNPVKELVESGAEIIFNLSASPWTWQKNRKRHSIVKDLLNECRVPLVYVNNTGIQNNGKNIIIFDGSSTVYGKTGQIIFEVPPYGTGSHDFQFDPQNKPAENKLSDDTEELYLAIRCAVGEFFKTLPPASRKAIVGLSGGIDSALVATLLVDVLGRESVIAVNMPSQYNSSQTQDLARLIAGNLGVKYEVRPIQSIVESIATTAGVVVGSPAHANIQARARMEILAAMAQRLNCVFSANWNKVEVAFGYGTLYGDMAGFFAPLGDLVKREVYQLADYFNRVVYRREIIPQKCFDIKPTAELEKNQVDPFAYGSVSQRGYHDEMVRAFTEFRLNPEWFLEKYIKGELEGELKIEPGILAKLFPEPKDFIEDLEKRWSQFFGSYFKRIQSAPIPIVSKRAFGYDLRESLVPSHLTQRYADLKWLALSRIKTVAEFGGSFNPPCRHHQKIALALTKRFDLVIVVPCGSRSDKESVNALEKKHRGEMAKLAFAHLPKLIVDLFDLSNDSFTPACLLQERYQKMFPGTQIWHVVGGDIVTGGGEKKSAIHQSWCEGKKIWEDFNYVVIERPYCLVKPEDMPPFSTLLKVDENFGSGTMIRERISNNLPIDGLLEPAVREYIDREQLYRDKTA